MSNIIALKDIEKIDDKLLVSNIKNKVYKDLSSGIKGTRIIMRDSDGNETELHNKVVISGSIATALSLFNLEHLPVPNYNDGLGLENSLPSETTPTNRRLICLFGVGDDGCGTVDSDVFTPSYIDRIPPSKLYPFRFIASDKRDLDPTDREVYFGRKLNAGTNADHTAYYFKAFNDAPQIYLRYTDGTEINPATMYNILTTQEAECFVKVDLSISRLDFRDYFNDEIGWDKARISSLSLCYAWYTETTESGNRYKWYQDIIPFTKLNFTFEKLVDSTKALAFEYSLFF